MLEKLRPKIKKTKKPQQLKRHEQHFGPSFAFFGKRKSVKLGTNKLQCKRSD